MKEVHTDQSPLSARKHDKDVIHQHHTPTGHDEAVDLRNLHDDSHDVLEASGHNVRHKRFVSDMMKQVSLVLHYFILELLITSSFPC